jgi:hypothetical protein
MLIHTAGYVTEEEERVSWNVHRWKWGRYEASGSQVREHFFIATSVPRPSITLDPAPPSLPAPSPDSGAVASLLARRV